MIQPSCLKGMGLDGPRARCATRSWPSWRRTRRARPWRRSSAAPAASRVTSPHRASVPICDSTHRGSSFAKSAASTGCPVSTERPAVTGTPRLRSRSGPSPAGTRPSCRPIASTGSRAGNPIPFTPSSPTPRTASSSTRRKNRRSCAHAEAASGASRPPSTVRNGRPCLDSRCSPLVIWMRWTSSFFSGRAASRPRWRPARTSSSPPTLCSRTSFPGRSPEPVWNAAARSSGW